MPLANVESMKMLWAQHFTTASEWSIFVLSIAFNLWLLFSLETSVLKRKLKNLKANSGALTSLKSKIDSVANSSRSVLSWIVHGESHEAYLGLFVNQGKSHAVFSFLFQQRLPHWFLKIRSPAPSSHLSRQWYLSHSHVQRRRRPNLRLLVFQFQCPSQWSPLRSATFRKLCNVRE